VTNGSCWLLDNGADEGLESAGLRGLTSSGENAVRAVFGVPWADSTAPLEYGGDCP
jgi:hypothetical protein